MKKGIKDLPGELYRDIAKYANNSKMDPEFGGGRITPFDRHLRHLRNEKSRDLHKTTIEGGGWGSRGADIEQRLNDWQNNPENIKQLRDAYNLKKERDLFFAVHGRYPN